MALIAKKTAYCMRDEKTKQIFIKKKKNTDSGLLLLIEERKTFPKSIFNVYFPPSFYRHETNMTCFPFQI